MELEAILTILLSWASNLSGYPMSDVPPEVHFKSHDFFVENVCGGKECKVVGWYNDADVVYIDKRYHKLESRFATSLVVHEFTHFLQHKSQAFESLSCVDSVAREREAYHIQNLYIVEAMGSINTIMPGRASCNYVNAGLSENDE